MIFSKEFFTNKVTKPMMIAYWLLFVVAVASYLFDDLDSILTLLPEFFLVFMYVFSSRKMHDYVLGYFVFLCLGDVFTVLHQDVFDLITYSIGHFFLILYLFKDIRSKLSKNIFLYLVLFLLIFFVIYFFIIKRANQLNIPVIIYGISLCVLATLLFYMYLNKLNTIFLILFVGILLKIISDSLMSIRVYGDFDNQVYFAMVQGLYFLSHFLICYGLIKK